MIPLDGPYIQYQGKKILDFSSYDFLGLSQHPEVKKNAIKYTLRYGVGVPPFKFAAQLQLEEKLAHYLGMESAAFFPCFEQAKECVMALKATIVSSLTHLPSKENGFICVDDSETFGILGPRGMGIGAEQKGADLILGSLTKGCGNFGAFIATSKKLKPHFTASSLPPSVLGALDAAFNLIPEMESERQTLIQHTNWLKSQLEEKGWKIPKTPLPILTLSLQTEKEAEKLHRFFEEESIFVRRGEDSQIVFILTALHTPDDLDQLSLALKKLSATDFALATQSLTPTPRK